MKKDNINVSIIVLLFIAIIAVASIEIKPIIVILRMDDIIALLELFLVLAMVSLFISTSKKLSFFQKKKKTLSNNEKSWWEEDGIFYISIEYESKTGREFLVELERNDNLIGEKAEEIIKFFKPKNNYRATLVIFPGRNFAQHERNFKRLLSLPGQEPKLKIKLAWSEMACSLRLRLSTENLKEMNLENIVVVHTPQNDKILSVDKYPLGCSSISAVGIDDSFGYYTGLAFLKEDQFIK